MDPSLDGSSVGWKSISYRLEQLHVIVLLAPLHECDSRRQWNDLASSWHSRNVGDKDAALAEVLRHGERPIYAPLG
jgi:hypothetical protein